MRFVRRLRQGGLGDVAAKDGSRNRAIDGSNDLSHPQHAEAKGVPHVDRQGRASRQCDIGARCTSRWSLAEEMRVSRASSPRSRGSATADRGRRTPGVRSAREDLEAAAQRIAKLERAVRDKDEIIARRRSRRRELERAAAVKNRFLAVVAHDLRGPLHSVLDWTRLLRREHFDRAGREAALRAIERSARMQLALLEELVDLTALSGADTPLELTRFDVVALVRHVVDSLCPRAEARGVALTRSPCATYAPLHADRRRLERAMSSLIATIVDGSNAGEHVDVDLDTSTKDVDHVAREPGCKCPRGRR
jgi:signal transduction histidine kinase